MTQHDTQRTRPAYEAFRDAFGAELIGAVRERESAPRRRRWRRRGWMAVPALVVAAGAFTLVDLSARGPDDAPVLSTGAAAAAAAVRELSDSLERGVLVRVAINRGLEVTTESDWTDLATRARHTRLQNEDVDVEFWNPSLHERWTLDHEWRSADGRAVVTYTDDDSENSSSSATPSEEVAELLTLARRGELSLRRDRDALVIERTERCFASADLGFMECGDSDGRWPDSPPGELKAVTHFQTWWLAADGRPRILRHENGAIDAGSNRRDVVFRSDYRRWEVLPPTAQNLRLAHPPAFPADRYLVLKSSDAFADAVRDGRVRSRP